MQAQHILIFNPPQAAGHSDCPQNQLHLWQPKPSSMLTGHPSSAPSYPSSLPFTCSLNIVPCFHPWPPMASHGLLGLHFLFNPARLHGSLLWPPLYHTPLHLLASSPRSASQAALDEFLDFLFLLSGRPFLWQAMHVYFAGHLASILSEVPIIKWSHFQEFSSSILLAEFEA